MKIKTALFLTICLGFLMVCSTLTAQEKKTQKFWVHEDMVKPNKVMEYEKASKAFVETCQKHAGAEAHFMTMSSDDMRYIFISPIENMAQLDENPFAAMDEALGKEGSAKVWSSWDGMFTTHKDYIINLSHELSYNSGEIMEEGINYRNLTYYYIYPDKMQEAKALAKEWKELYASKSIPQGYRIYTGGMGTEPHLMVVQWAKSAAEFYAQQEKTRETLGDAASELYARTLAVTKKIETIDGQMRPELSFTSSSTMADN